MNSWSSTTKIPQIPIVIDSKTNEHVSIIGMNYLYEQDELAYVRLNNLREKRFRCYRCNHVAILSCRSDPDSLHGHYYFFRHTPDVQCEGDMTVRQRRKSIRVCKKDLGTMS